MQGRDRYSKFSVEAATKVLVKDDQGNLVSSFVVVGNAVGGSFDQPLKEAIPNAVRDAMTKVNVLSDYLAEGINRNEQNEEY
jgi:hypothetical protein